MQPHNERFYVVLRSRRPEPSYVRPLVDRASVVPAFIRAGLARSVGTWIVVVATVCLGWSSRNALAEPSQGYGLGSVPSDAEIRAWDISVSPDGDGLPKGRGTVQQGAEIYSIRCAECHGEQGEGGDAEALAGGHRTLRSPRPLKTVGSYWPYSTTVWDYVRRAMPFDRPGMLTVDQVYALVAYVLYLNGTVEQTAELNEDNLADVLMPNRDSFAPAAEIDTVVEPSRPANLGE